MRTVFQWRLFMCQPGVTSAYRSGIALDVDGAAVGRVGEQEHFTRYLVDQRRLVERGRFLALRQRQAEFAYVEYIHMDAFVGRSDSSRPSLCRSR